MTRSSCQQCGEHCRIGSGLCEWRYTRWCTESLTELRRLDTDAFVYFQRLIAASEAEGIEGHHNFPLRRTQGYAMGELKAAGAKNNERCEYRLYYGQPEQPVNRVVGLKLAEKVIHGTAQATTRGQDSDIGSAANAFRAWLKEQRQAVDQTGRPPEDQKKS